MSGKAAHGFRCGIFALDVLERVFVQADVKFETLLHDVILRFFQVETPDLLGHAVGTGQIRSPDLYPGLRVDVVFSANCRADAAGIQLWLQLVEIPLRAVDVCIERQLTGHALELISTPSVEDHAPPGCLWAFERHDRAVASGFTFAADHDFIRISTVRLQIVELAEAGE